MRPLAALIICVWMCAWWISAIHAQQPCSFNSLCWCRPGQISCVAVPLHRLPELISTGLVHVEVAGAGLKSVESGALDALRLQSLAMPDNRLHSLPEKAFSSMAMTLSSLDLGFNDFTEVPFNILKTLKILNWLNLQNNNIVSLNGDWAYMKDSLTSLILTGNYISEITSGTLTQLKHLNKLDIDGNRIQTVTRKSLPTSLQSLNIANNLLEHFPYEVFSYLHHLQILNLKGNLIHRISPTTFKHHKSLDKLELGDNGLEVWPSNIFNETLAIRYLSIELNRLKIIPANSFKGMNTVKLILSYNYIEFVDEHAFKGLEHTLEYLDLENNQLMDVPRSILELKRLKNLYLPSNKIITVDFLPQHIKVLSLNGNLLNFVPRDALRNCTLTHLDIGYNLIAYIEDGDFDVWGESIRTLYLRSNKITRLDAGAFSALPQLRELSLSFNDIHYVHPDVFANASQYLKILELSFSIYRDDFPADVLRHLANLEWVSIDNNNIQTLTTNSFTHFPRLQYFSMEFNRLTNIPPEFFDDHNIENVKEINFSYNLLDGLDAETIADFPELQVLDFSMNRIRNISSHAIKNLPKLMHVALYDNLLSEIGDSAFVDLPSLLKLELQNNMLREVSLRSFRNVTVEDMPVLLNISRNQLISLEANGPEIFVETLDVSYNRLADVPTIFVSKISKKLKRCVMSYNEIGHLDTNAFDKLLDLDVLNLDHNYISYLRRRAFYGLRSLQILDLSHNRIEQLSVEQFSNLNNLRFLNLRRNHIRTLPRDVFKNTMIEHLDLGINEFNLLPSLAFSQIGFTLRHLDLSHNNIESLDSTLFQETPFLLSLDLSSNKLTILSDNLFNSLGSLQVLDLSSNYLRANFKELLHYLPVTRYLSLSNTGLKSFPPVPIRNLTSLNLTYNFIDNIKESSVKDLGSLRNLYLKGNSFSSLPSHVWSIMPKLKTLDLSRNPIETVVRSNFYGLKNLVDLNIQALHKLKSFDLNALSHLRCLKYLQIETKPLLKDYKLRSIVSEVPGLRRLQVHINEESIENQLNGVFVPKLKDLEISGDKVKKITAEAFEGADKLYDLSVKISGTEIKELPAGFLRDLGKIPQLTVDVSKNQLASIGPAVLYPNTTTWEKLATKLIAGGFSVYDNPLPCDCGVAWLGRWIRRWVRESGVSGRSPPLAECSRNGHYSYSIASNRLLRLYPEDLRCHASALAAAASITSKHLSVSLMAVVSNLVIVRFILF